jgi:hypothetical protein
MDSDLHFVLVTTGTELRACPQGTSVANCKAPPLLISNMKRPRPSRDATRVPSPVVVLVSRLLFGRRSVMSEGAARGGGRATRTRRARRAYIAGGSHRRSSAGTSHAAVVLSSSLVPSPVVVLVSPLHFGRRSVLSEGAARGGRRVTRARRARRAYIAGGSHRRSSAGTSRAAVVLSSLSVLLSCLSSRPSLRGRATPSLHPRNLRLSI